MKRHSSFASRRALAAAAAVVVAGAGLVGLAPGTAGAAAPPTVVGYDSIPAPLPGNVASTGFEATSTSELGDSIGLTTSSGSLDNARVVLSSWGCQTRPGGVCTTTPGATFSHSLTFKVYAVDMAGEPGAVLASKTQTFAIPYRPSENVNCTGGRWSPDGGANCFNGFATTVTFDFSATHPVLPANVIWSVSYNTTHHGYTPIGEAAPCFSTAAGCGYDSLNVGTDDNGAAAPAAGTDTDPDGILWNTSVAGFYCDGGAGGTGTFRIDTGPPSPCWTGYRPEAQLNMLQPTVSTASVTVPEGNTTHAVNVPVTLSSSSPNPVTVKYKTRNGNATLSDYNATTGTLIIPAGQTTGSVAVTVLGDATPENFEHFFVDFTVPTNATLNPPGSKITSTVTLQNDDAPTLKFANLVTNEGSTPSETFTLSKPYYQAITLTVNTANNTAVAPGDYDAITNVQVTFPAGTVGPIALPVNAKIDGVSGEPLEKYNVTATSASLANPSLTHSVSISKNNS